jgi:hypothetical protein
MNVGFLVLRETFLKTMGSLIIECLRAGCAVTLFFDDRSASGPKAYQQVKEEKLAIFEKSGARLVRVDSSDLKNISQETKIDVIVVMEGYHFFRSRLAELEKLREAGTKIVSLSHFFENLRHSFEGLNHFDKTFYLSSFALDAHFSLYGGNTARSFKKRYAPRFEIAGSPMFDQFLSLSRDEFRRELGIPSEKQVVVLFAPVVNTVTDWRNYLWGEKSKIKRLWRILTHRKFQYLWDAFSMPTFAEIAKSIRRFCDRNNAFLVVKSRVKQNDRNVFEDVADLLISGEEEIYFPVFTSYKVLACADLCISAMSMAVLESRAANVPVVNIYLPPTEYKSSTSELYPDKTEYLDAIMNIEHESPFSYPGCVEVVDRRKAAGWFDKKDLKDFDVDPEARLVYLERFLGFASESSSRRILSSIEELLQTQKNTFPRKLEPQS